jgi:membrane protein DedA with SNARE-associated domain
VLQLQALLDWLAAQPPAALLGAMALLAAVENIFPPIPADVLVAFGGFLAARTGASPWPSFLAIWLGNVAGALVMYAAGRRLGRAWIARRFRLAPDSGHEERLTTWHARYGAGALFLSRFVPGVRAVVPPLAGALRFPPVSLAVAIAAASALWYGAITWVAFSTGDNWELVTVQLARMGRWSGIAAVAIALSVALVWWRRRRR